MYPPEEWSEGYIFETVREKYILGDGERFVELHHLPGLPQVAGMLIAYLPEENLVIEADLYTPPSTGDALPDAPSASNLALYTLVQRLGLDVERIVPIHGRPTSMESFTVFARGAQ